LIFDWSLRGRINYGRANRRRSVLFLNTIWQDEEDKAGAVVTSELHENLHAVLHKLCIREWRNENAIWFYTLGMSDLIADIWRENGYLRTWAEIELMVDN